MSSVLDLSKNDRVPTRANYIKILEKICKDLVDSTVGTFVPALVGFSYIVESDEPLR